LDIKKRAAKAAPAIAAEWIVSKTAGGIILSLKYLIGCSVVGLNHFLYPPP
jgi:hypothetical protein